MNTQSPWKAQFNKQSIYPTLNQEISVDIAIIGGGITGITAAQHLIQNGKKVAIIEALSIGEGTTGDSTGNLYIPVQPYYQNILKKFDNATVNTILSSRQFAIDYIEKIAAQENINCHFARRPWFLYTNNPEQIKFLETEVELMKKNGVAIDLTTSLPLNLEFKSAALLDNQARFNPLIYVTELAARLATKGCLIYENSRVIQSEETNNGVIFHTAQGKVFAKHGIIATHTPIGVNFKQMCLAAYRSYGVAAHLEDNIYPEGNFWDLNQPHHAICTHSDNGKALNLIIVSGNHHKTGQRQPHHAYYQDLENFLSEKFKISKFVYHWSAQHYHSADDVPYIGLADGAKHTYIATGYFADGLIYGTLAGIIIGNAILNNNKIGDWQKKYDATRFTPIASWSFFVKDNINVLMQYLKDLPTFKTTPYEDIKIGKGKVLEINHEKCAISRDANNQLHIVSAVCSHMKGIVNWNDEEKTWDCPCHGSRFTKEGKVIEGPAQFDLEKK